jgi:hypothetical protein
MQHPQRKFFGVISMETTCRRRGLVVCYYIALALALGSAVWARGLGPFGRLGFFVYSTALLLGGLTIGPVRPFSGRLKQLQDKFATPWQKRWSLAEEEIRAYQSDERDLQARDRAHYQAYIWQRWLLMAGAAALLLVSPSLSDLGHFLTIVLVPFLAVFFSLPQAILLWTEPDFSPDAESFDL